MTRVDGKLIRATLGRYPALTLANACVKAGNIMELAASGFDPRKVESDQRNQYEAELRNTFGKIAAGLNGSSIRKGDLCQAECVWRLNFCWTRLLTPGTYKTDPFCNNNISIPYSGRDRIDGCLKKRRHGRGR